VQIENKAKTSCADREQGDE
jgi:hypothetical protein